MNFIHPPHRLGTLSDVAMLADVEDSRQSAFAGGQVFAEGAPDGPAKASSLNSSSPSPLDSSAGFGRPEGFGPPDPLDSSAAFAGGGASDRMAIPSGRRGQEGEQRGASSLAHSADRQYMQVGVSPNDGRKGVPPQKWRGGADPFQPQSPARSERGWGGSASGGALERWEVGSEVLDNEDEELAFALNLRHHDPSNHGALAFEPPYQDPCVTFHPDGTRGTGGELGEQLADGLTMGGDVRGTQGEEPFPAFAALSASML